MKKINKLQIITLVLLGFAIGIITKQILQTAYYKKVENKPVIAKIQIIEDFINVRQAPNAKSSKLFEALLNEEYNVVSIINEEYGVYTWYEIVFSDRRTGWVASYNDDPWVIEK